MQPKGALIDLSGVLYVGNEPLPGALEALQRLRDAALPLCFVTNTTRRPRAAIVQDLNAMGFDIADSEVMTAAQAARNLVVQEGLHPYLLLHPNLEADFEGLHSNTPDSLVVGDLGEGFTYARLNAAFRAVTTSDASPRLIAMAENRCFREGDGLSLDMGPFVRALECALDTRAEITGKPAAGFFNAALKLVGCSAKDAVMIGDDAENDIAGANAAGIPGILVKTGKYQPGDEKVLEGQPVTLSDDFAGAVQHILDSAI